MLPRILFATFGSYGDLYPYIAIGIELQKLGHRVVLATSAGYREKVESERLGFVPVRPDVSLEDREMLRFFFDQRRGTERVMRAMGEVIRASYEDIFNAASDADVIVTHPIAMAAVAVAEKRRLPWISSVLAPISFLFAYDPPIPAAAPWLTGVRQFGPSFMGAVWSFVNLLPSPKYRTRKHAKVRPNPCRQAAPSRFQNRRPRRTPKFRHTAHDKVSRSWIKDRSLLLHPNVPCERPCLLIGYWATRQLQSQLDLTVMVSLVPDHVLKHEDRMIVVKIHVAACLHSALQRLPQYAGALIQHLGDAITITLDEPFFLEHVSGELGRVLGH
jgi:UDP:flavonoid glycosyltransferase YjiC (YdhE family)